MSTDWLNRCHFGDCLETLRRMPDGIVNTCVTSPPYFGLRQYCRMACG
jgi:DNA modification methylase